jgi:hypothetical protein
VRRSARYAVTSASVTVARSGVTAAGQELRVPVQVAPVRTHRVAGRRARPPGGPGNRVPPRPIRHDGSIRRPCGQPGTAPPGTASSTPCSPRPFTTADATAAGYSPADIRMR